MEPTHDEDDFSFLDEKTGSNHKTEFIINQEVQGLPVLTDDEIMEILNYAFRINQ
jgi:hypothetical protein